MPSVGMRRTTRVFRMVKSSEVARVLRSGRRLWPDSGEAKPKRLANEGDENYNLMKKAPKSEVNGVAAEVSGRPKRLGNEENPRKQSRKMKAGALNTSGSVDKMFGIVYTRKRKRNGVQNGHLSGNSEQGNYGKKISRRQTIENRNTNEDVEEPKMFSFVVENGDCNGCFSNFLILVLGYVKRAEVRLSELAAFLMSQPISSVYSSNGVNFFWGPRNRTGICKFFGAKDSIPLFSLDFSAVPRYFLYMHYSKVLRLKRIQIVPVNSDEVVSDSEEDEPCVTSVVDVCKSTSGNAAVEIDNLGSKVVLHPSVRASKLTGRNAQCRNGLSSRSIQKRRSSLRRRRARNPSIVAIHKANGALMSDLISSRRNGIPFSSVVSKNKLRSSVRNSSVANVSDVGSSISDLMQNVDSSQCSANILVIEADRCYREEGAIVTLELSASREWLLVVKKGSSTKFACKADKFMRPSSCNRFTHAIIWTGDDNWKLEFPNRQDWIIFKDLYKECSERNVPASTVKAIPVPGVHEVPGYEDRRSVPFCRPDFYISLDGDEVSRALAKRTANYDMDSEDEEWLKKFNNEFFSGNGHCEHLSEDCFELMVDAFEKAYFCSPDDYSNENAAAHLCLDLGTRGLVEAVHTYWLRKRKQRRSALLRVFQGHQVKKAPLVPKPFLRKRRSFKRQASHGRGKQPYLLQGPRFRYNAETSIICNCAALAAERDSMAEQNAMLKLEEARVSASRSVELAVLKRQRTQLLMENADLATYKAMMALRIAEAARFTESSDVAVAHFFDL
ncbi:hypothetical protein QUC31_006246 [Theobroma cacao]